MNIAYRDDQPRKLTMTHGDFARDATFRAACKAAGVEPTKRQAAKFRRGEGRAYAARRQGGGV